MTSVQQSSNRTAHLTSPSPVLMEGAERTRLNVLPMQCVHLGTTCVLTCHVLLLVKTVVSNTSVLMISLLIVRIRLVRLIQGSVLRGLLVQELGRLFVLIRLVWIMLWSVRSLILVKPDISSSLTEPNKK